MITSILAWVSGVFCGISFEQLCVRRYGPAAHQVELTLATGPSQSAKEEGVNAMTDTMRDLRALWRASKGATWGHVWRFWRALRNHR